MKSHVDAEGVKFSFRERPPFKVNLVESFKRAVESIPEDYIAFKVASSKQKHLQERVVCYELYHQLRLLPEISSHPGLRVFGEVDKVSNPSFSREKPDFIVHEPGTNGSNLLVAEVKTALITRRICNDLNKLSKYVERHGYSNGILLIVGPEWARVERCLMRAVTLQPNLGWESVIVLSRESGQSAVKQKSVDDFLG